MSASPFPPASSVQSLSLHALLRFGEAVKRRWGVIASTLLLAASAGVIFYVKTDRLYEARAELLVMGPPRAEIAGMAASDRSLTEQMPTHQKVIASDVVIEGALSRLTEEDLAELRGTPEAEWVQAVRDRMQVSTARKADILELSVLSENPQTAVRLVDALLASYLDFMSKTQKGGAGELLQSSYKERSQLAETIQQKEQALLEAQHEAGEVVVRNGEQGPNVVAARALQLNDALVKAHQTRLAAQALAAAIEADVREGRDLQQHALSLLEQNGRELLAQQLGLNQNDAEVQRVNAQIVEDYAKLRSYEQYYGPNHPQIQTIIARIQSAEQYLNERRRQTAMALRQTQQGDLANVLLSVARQRVQQALEHENSLRTSFESEQKRAVDLSARLSRMEVLQAELTRLRGSFDVVLDRIRKLDVEQDRANVRMAVVGEPQTPTSPVWPSPSLVALISVVSGVGLGLILVYVLDMADDRYRTAEEVSQHLNLPVLGVLGRVQASDAGPATWEVHARPGSVESESFRTLHTAIALRTESSRLLVVSSSLPGDGKTTIVSNLAVASAQAGRRTLLIDADMRRPGLTTAAALRGKPGLSQLLRDARPIEESAPRVLQREAVENLDVIPAGARPANPIELLSGQRFSELLAWAEGEYEQVLIDCPPALGISDALLAARVADGLLLVVRPEKDHRGVVARTAQHVQSLGVKILGVAVNDANPQHKTAYYGYASHYHSEYAQAITRPESDGATLELSSATDAAANDETAMEDASAAVARPLRFPTRPPAARRPAPRKSA